ncbi:hypothetical protein J3U08_09855 [Gilliamella sp. B2894]|uniref:hypothetical protein n=1 Tax=Gilliamella sp. B2894 TaxID=2817978 RepID=UPI00226A8506|nr:hypothetical protein [Gilliamella sp. B2894]MCX8657095.1 hypothetical protein [Gilliamella sp. B2894]
MVKAFNTIFAQLIPKEARKADKIPVFIATNDEAAREFVTKLVRSLAFEPILLILNDVFS